MRYARSSPKRVAVIVTCSVLAAVLLIGGILFAVRQNTLANRIVEVEPVMNWSTTYWGDETSTSGVVTSDFVQEVYPNQETSISEIFVKEGDTVKIGDVLLQYDTTRLELNVESKRLDVQRQQYDLEQKRKELVKLQNTRPYVPPADPPQDTPDMPGFGEPSEPSPTPTPVSEAALQSVLSKYSEPYAGSGTAEDPYVFLCTSDCTLTRSFFLRLLGLSDLIHEEDEADEAGLSGTSVSRSKGPVKRVSVIDEDPGAQPDPDPSAAPSDEPTAEPSAEPTVVPEPAETPEPTVEPGASPSPAPTEEPSSTPETTPSPSPTPDVFLLPNGPFSARLEIHEENNEKLPLISGWAMNGELLTGGFLSNEGSDGFLEGLFSDDDFSIQLLSADSTGGIEVGDQDSMYTADELKELIRQAQQAVRDLELAVRQAELDLKKAEIELRNATVTATVNGTVKTLIEIDEAVFSNSPFLVVAGSGGFYVEGTLNESLLGRINVGDTVTANSWESGGTYEAQIISISEFPTTSMYYYSGSDNPNSSSYRFKAYIPESDGLRNNMWVDIMMNASAESGGSDHIYLYQAYVRKDDKGSYVLKAEPDLRVHKSYVTTGKTVYSSYVEITAGDLSASDYIAFPYGKNAVDGARVDPEQELTFSDSEV